MSSTGAVIARILTQYSDKGSKEAQKDIARLTKKFDDFGKRVKKSFAVAITATAALSVKIGKDAVDAAIEDSKTQLILANAMRNSTGATDELIASAEDYIKTTMFRVNVADDELRLSLKTLYVATGDLTEAQRIQTIALDVAAASGKDLSTVTLGITKAQQGNVGALKKLSPEISALITKTTKFEDILAILGGTYYGTAEQLAELDPLTGLKLAYGEVLETLGYELLPVIKEFAGYVKDDLLPIIEEWIVANGDNLRDGLNGIIKTFMTLGSIALDIGKILNNDFIQTVLKLAAVLIGAGKVLKIFGRFVGGIVGKTEGVKNSIKGLIDTFKSFSGSDSGLYKAVELIGKLIENFGKFILLIPGAQVALAFFRNSWDALFGSSEKLGKSIDKTTQKTYNQMRMDQIAAEAAKKRAEALKKAQEEAARAAAKAAAEAKKQAALEAAIQKKVLAIRKQLNITKDSAIDKETDLIQLGAAEFFLKKQGIVAKEELAKLNRLKEENFLLEVRETLSQRYLDIQKKIADGVIDTKEIEELSKKWGISIESTEMYIHLVDSINDGTISDAEVEKLAKMWGSSNEQAKAFLETYLRIHDGILTEAEVFDLLQQGWAKTEDEVRFYADAVAVIHDGIAKDEDFQRLADKWDKSREEVNKYIGSMGAKFDYQGVFLDPVIALAVKWDAATEALKRYLKALEDAKGFQFGVTPPTVPTTPLTPVTPVTPTVPTTPGGFPEVQIPDGIMPSAQAATVYALAKAAGDMETAAKAAAQVNPTTIAAAESGAIGAASIAAQLKAAEQQVAYAATLASFKEKEAADAAKAAATASSMDYDERFRFQSSLMNNAASIPQGASSAPINVTVNVAGSVTTEEDLVQTVRNGLLGTQYNGNSLLLQAI